MMVLLTRVFTGRGTAPKGTTRSESYCQACNQPKEGYREQRALCEKCEEEFLKER